MWSAVKGLELFAFGPGWGDELVRGFRVTVELAVLSYLAGTGLGLLAALGEISRYRTLSTALQVYALVLRSVPELLVIFLFYFGGGLLVQALLAPFGVARVEVSAFAAGLVALSLIQGAYASEVFRGALAAVPHGLNEAAYALGMHAVTVNLTITLPLAFRYALPGLVNLWMVIVKTTVLVSAIGLEDFVRSASTAGQNTKEYFTFYSAVLVTYLVLSGLTMVAQALLDRWLFQHMEGARA
jgi:His/Glu/Gln/Arg/opine family amino acid ABC transporter permease subunit